VGAAGEARRPDPPGNHAKARETILQLLLCPPGCIGEPVAELIGEGAEFRGVAHDFERAFARDT
jgi:hypothetical protein